MKDNIWTALAFVYGPLILLALLLVLSRGDMLASCSHPLDIFAADPPQLVGKVDGCGEAGAEMAVSLIGGRTGEVPNIRFTLYGGSRIGEDGTYVISLDDVAPGSYEVLLWGEDGLPLTVQPVELNRPLRGEIEGPDFVIKEAE